ncbi:uncharacterized protein PAC_09407 [Phialocephala subalpina]|uniref:Uncharacterized protein n=1 Tax=Phialocephala subalpina TaxID=576137 RepID=A0A1L7X3B5_9HELO|nr:uncharacterized protein PAC_09407 [Phialocephala subalpina]
MDFSARILDLVRASADNVVKGSSVVDVSRELYTWIVRERIPESAFNYCAELVTCVTHPNEYGLQLRDNLAKPTSKTTKISGLNINLAGSVGRLMSFDIDYCYMVTTVAVVMEFHDMAFASTVLCNMALDKGGHDGGVVYPYDIRRTRIKPVITKIVDSIALNVVNCGHTLQALPDELQGLCIHVTDPETFAAVIMAVQRATENIVLLCDVLYGDVIAWLIAHFMGIIEISIAGKRTFEKRCGSREVRATVVVVHRCSTRVDGHPNLGETAFLELSTNTSGVKKTVLQAGPSWRSGPTPTARMALYDTSNISKRRPTRSLRNEELHTFLTPSEISDIQLNAQAVLDWLLNLHIKPENRTVAVGFGINLSSNQGSLPNIGSLLSNWPGLLHKNFGGPLRSLVIFTPPTETSREKHANRGKHGSKVAWADILECFPTIRTLLDNIRPRCRCNSCQNETPVDYNYRQPGCLPAMALTVLLTLLSHAITDGFGAVDVSGICQSKIELPSLAMQKVLSELIFDKRVLWRTWFSIAALNVLGCSLGDSLEAPDHEVEEGASEPVAVQYGSLVIVAKWVDLTVEQHFQGCFGFHCTEGSLVEVGDEYAVVYSEKSMQPPEALGDTSWTFSSSNDYESPSGDSNDIIDAWEAKSNSGETSMANICVNTAIIGAGSPYRLLTMIKSDGYLRIVDPSEILAALSKSETFQSGHGGSHPVDACLDRKYISFWTFDELLGAWDNSNYTYDRNTQAVVPLNMATAIIIGGPVVDNLPMYYVTTNIETYLELNVAMALSPFDGCLIKRRDDCLPCAIARLKDLQEVCWSNGPRILICDKGIRPLGLIAN